jgi:uncharacterized membrane protein YhaH (DUF805 family)
MNFFKTFFSPRGRIGRKAYAAAFLVNFLMLYAPMLLGVGISNGGIAINGSHFLLIAIVIFYLCLIISFLFINIKRFRDVGINPFLGLLYIIFPIAMLFFQPTDKEVKF